MTTMAGLLVRTAREFPDAGWIFTGFHWPVLAAQMAHELWPGRVVTVFEGGAALTSAPAEVPTSTTDSAAYSAVCGWRGNTADTLLALASRFDRVVLDAGNVDLRGRVNSTAIGDRRAPKVRLPGGGGAPDVAAVARDLVLVHGGDDPARLAVRVGNATAVPGPRTPVRLITRWGVLRLGERPRLLERAPGPAEPEFLARLTGLGVSVDGAAPWAEPAEEELAMAHDVFARAARRGYTVARRALEETALDEKALEETR